MIRKLALAITLICCIAVLTGCNTMKGFGKDVKGLGEKIEDVSE
ncbi:MAG: entericidin A/B family lipoprotein [Nitrospirae bacterium]|nr:entericidin A/B family lipoprotein [Nitrospirota bacterium]